MRLLLIWLINAAALFAVPYLMHSVSMSSGWTALLAAALLGLVNALIRPLLVLLTLPVTFLSLGLFILMINGFLFWLVAQVVEAFMSPVSGRPWVAPFCTASFPGPCRPYF